MCVYIIFFGKSLIPASKGAFVKCSHELVRPNTLAYFGYLDLSLEIVETDQIWVVRMPGQHASGEQMIDNPPPPPNPSIPAAA